MKVRSGLRTGGGKLQLLHGEASRMYDRYPLSSPLYRRLPLHRRVLRRVRCTFVLTVFFQLFAAVLENLRVGLFGTPVNKELQASRVFLNLRFTSGLLAGSVGAIAWDTMAVLKLSSVGD